MKNLILLIAMLSATNVFAQDLKSVMKTMGTDLKLLSTQVADPRQNASSLALAEELLKATQESRGLVPDPARKDLYVQMIDHAADLANQLVNSLRAGDNAKAKALVDSLTAAKKEGHNEFN